MSYPVYLKGYIEGPNSLNSKANRNGKTALIVAARKGLVAMARLLLNAGADKDLADHVGNTALICATRAPSIIPFFPCSSVIREPEPCEPH